MLTYLEFPFPSLPIYMVLNAPFPSRGNVFGVSLPRPWDSAQLPVVRRLWFQTCKICCVTYARRKLK